MLHYKILGDISNYCKYIIIFSIEASKKLVLKQIKRKKDKINTEHAITQKDKFNTETTIIEPVKNMQNEFTFVTEE